MAQRIPRAGLLLAVVLLLLVPALPGKTKPKSTEKQNQDFSKFVEIPGATKVGGDQCAQCHLNATLFSNIGNSGDSCGADLQVCSGPPGPALRATEPAISAYEEADVDVGRRTGVLPHE